jgi:hypothetical protein
MLWIKHEVWEEFGLKVVKNVTDTDPYSKVWLKCLELLARSELNAYMGKKRNNCVYLMHFGVSRKIDVYDKSKRTWRRRQIPTWRPSDHLNITPDITLMT